MKPIRLRSAAEQVAEYLRDEVQREHWEEKIPGVGWLARELEVNRKTVEAALQLLEEDGLLVSQGPGRNRTIKMPVGRAVRPLRVALLDFDPLPLALSSGYTVELLHLLAQEGHAAFFTEKSLTELEMNVPRIRRMVEKTAADAWVVCSASREVLEWFVAQPVPVFAMFGRRSGLPVAAVGPDKLPATVAATRALIELGHHRIVMLTRGAQRLPEPGVVQRSFLDELEAHGISPGPYHLPDWEESIEGFYRCLESLFLITPPTALIIDEVPFYIATLHFCSTRGLRVPEDVSLVCDDDDPAFAWSRPTVSRIRWETRPVVKRIVRWAANVSRGKQDLRQTLTPAKFIHGETIGPVSRG